MKRYIIFTDLDGTLLDMRDYTADAAIPALREIKERNIPLIFATSKTAAEIKEYRIKLSVNHPFICENGGGIYIPEGYFRGEADPEQFEVIPLGLEYPYLRAELKSASEELNLELQGMGDMTDEEIIGFTGITEAEVPLARTREFDEPFVIKSEVTEATTGKLENYFRNKKLEMLKGNRFYHLMGNINKGKAVKALMKRFKESSQDEWTTIGLGDSPNDIAMFENVDIPIAVMKPPLPGHYDFDREDFPYLNFAEGIGPQGWNKAVLDIIKKPKHG